MKSQIILCSTLAVMAAALPTTTTPTGPAIVPSSEPKYSYSTKSSAESTTDGHTEQYGTNFGTSDACSGSSVTGQGLQLCSLSYVAPAAGTSNNAQVTFTLSQTSDIYKGTRASVQCTVNGPAGTPLTGHCANQADQAAATLIYDWTFDAAAQTLQVTEYFAQKDGADPNLHRVGYDATSVPGTAATGSDGSTTLSVAGPIKLISQGTIVG